MKRIKLITPVIASASTLAIAASSIAAITKINNVTKPVTQATKSSSVNAKDVISIDITTKSLSARQFMRYTAESVTWNGGEAKDSQLESIANSAFAYSGLKSFTIPSGVTTIDPMAFYHTEAMESLDLSLVQDKMLESDFTIGTHAFQDMGATKFDGKGFIFKSLADASEANNSMEIYDLTISYIKAMLAYAGANASWASNIISGNAYDQPSNTYNAIPRQLMKFDDSGNFDGFEEAKLLKTNASFDTIIFPKFMKGMTTDGLASFNTIKELGIIKNVGFISDTSSNDGITIEADWFKGWTTVEKVILPKNATVQSQTFANCSNLKYINMSQTSLTELPARVLYNAGDNGNGLNIVLPTTLTTIKKDSLTGAKVTVLEIPESVTTIESSACKDMSSLRYLYMSKNATSIGDYAFSGCKNLIQVVYQTSGNKLTNIGQSAFDGCSALEKLTLPSSMGDSSENGTVGASAFATSTSNKCDKIDFSNFTEAQINNVTFSTGCFDGWPSRGSVEMGEWSTTTQDAVMQKLYNAGLSTRWSKSNDVQSDQVLCVSYDTGTKLTLNAGSLAEEEVPDVQYSYTGKAKTWNTLSKNTEISLSDDYNVLYLKGKNDNGFTIKSEGEGYTQIGALSFTNSDPTKGVAISGNILGLIDNGEKTCTAIPNAHCFDKLFYDSTALQSIDESNALFLPATDLKENCYQGMFYGCKNLKYAPTLPATTLAKECYMNMFGEAGIKVMPTLPATTLAEGCYKGMFKFNTDEESVAKYGTSKLVTATTLATNDIQLAPYCYQEMFAGCTELQNAPTLPKTDDTASTPVSPLTKGCYYGMFNGCSKLVSAPELKAYNFPEDSCREMFKGCTSLVDAPYIKVQSTSTTHTYGTKCFANMFENDTALKTMHVQFINWPETTSDDATPCTFEWAKGLSTGGTFYCSTNLAHAEANFNINQIPIGWNVDEEDDKKDPEKKEDARTDACAQVDKATLFTLFTSDKWTQAGYAAPELWYRIKKANGDWELAGGIWTKYSEPVTVDAGCTIYFRCKRDTWAYKSTDTWSYIYSSLVFTNPNGYSAGSTGVHVKGNVMSLVLKGLGINTETGADESSDPTKYIFVDDDNAPGSKTLESEFCFANLFMGPGDSDYNNGEQATDNENTLYTGGLYNYCIEDIDQLFFSVPNLTYGIFTRAFCHCENMKSGPKITSREAKGSRSTKRIAFGDTFKGCTSLTEPSEMNLDSIPSSDDGYWTFHGTYYQCSSLTRGSDIPITDYSNTNSSSQTWAWCYKDCPNLKEIYWYALAPTSYSTSWHYGVFTAWTDNCGTSCFSGEKKTYPVLYMHKDFYDWLCEQYVTSNPSGGGGQGGGGQGGGGGHHDDPTPNPPSTGSNKLYGSGSSYGQVPCSTDLPWVIRDIDSGEILNTGYYVESDFTEDE